MRRALIAVGITLLVALGVGTACGRATGLDSAPGEAQMAASIGAPPPAAEAPAATPVVKRYAPPTASSTIAQADRSLIRTVDLELAADDTDAAADRIEQVAVDAGGYVSATDARRRDGVSYYAITLRVPAGGLDTILAGIKGIASVVDRENLRTEDVTDQIIDIDARLRTLIATETELQALLAASRERGDDLEDIMAVYRELTNLRAQIEQAEAQLESFRGRVALSTINITLRPTDSSRPVARRWSASDSLRNSVRALVAALQGVLDFAIFLVIVVLPVAVLVALPLWGLLKLWNQARARRVAPPSSG
jgi:hypothetical protein